MYQSSKVILGIYTLFISAIVICLGKRTLLGANQCGGGAKCMSIRFCPEMTRLVQSGNQANIKRVQEANCGFEKRTSLVCCSVSPHTSNTPPPPTPPPRGNGNALLPRLCGRPSTEDKIIGGTPAAIGAYPWMVAMGYTKPGRRNIIFGCSGSIINSKYVLTAAHCVNRGDLGGKRLAVLHLGDWDLSTEEDCQETRIGTRCSTAHIVAGFEEITIHPQYDKRASSSDDIALIRLNVTLDFATEEATVQPVCIPESSLDVRSFVGKRRPIAAGWGLTENTTQSDKMLRVDVPIVSEDQCKERYPQFIGNQLCVGGERGFDTCSGDSGGPLVLAEEAGPPFTQIGIVSYGPFPCGLQRFPGVYVSVKDYRNWILDNMKP